MGELFRRIRFLIERRRLTAELENDMEFHREMAARAGRNNFGNALRMRERAYEAWGWTWLDRLGQDLRYGVRILVRAPGFTLLAVLVLAVGIGVNVSAFSVLDMVALKPLPVPDADRIVRLERRSPGNFTTEMAYPSFLFYRDHARTLSATMAVLGVPPMRVDDDLQSTSASFVTPNYFTELGTRAALGRMFDPTTDASPDAPPVAVLSYELWQRRFQGDPGIVGRVIYLDRKPVTVVGIAPYAFAALGGQHPNIWLPMAQQPYFIERSKVLQDWTSSSVRMWGKLAPGVSAKTAEQELRALTDQIRRQHADAVWDQEFIQVSAGGHLQVMLPQMVQVVALVGVLTLLILIVCCANVGGLMLARAVMRQHEIEIRMALGAGRWRIFRQLCTESLMLGAMGAAAGLGLASAVIQVTLSRVDAPKWLSAKPDWRVLVFTAGMSAVATLFFGLMPALQIARQKQRKTLTRQILVGAQIAGSSVLFIVAALLVRATQHAIYTDPGFGYEQLVTVDPQLGHHGYTAAAAGAYLEQMESRLRNTPGVTGISLVQFPPLGHIIANAGTEIRGRKVTVYFNSVTPDFFRTMGIPLRMGRTFYPGEKHALVVSESFARQQWPGENPLGQLVGDAANKSVVIGVVGDAHINAMNDDDAVEQYWAAQPNDMPGMTLVIRAAGDPGSLAVAVNGISASLDKSIIPEFRRVKVLYRQDLVGIETAAGVVTLVGLIAVLVAGVGLAGLVAFVVTQRTKEIAIRMALGASPAAVLSAVLRQFRWPLLLGLTAGTVFAALGSKLLRAGLYGVSNLDPLSYAGALAVLGVIAAIAMVLPATRTLRLNLASILHHE
jgi:predicted permease